MTDATHISLSELNLRSLLAAPATSAAWHAEKRIDFLENKVERAQERLAALEAELAQAKDEWSQIQAGQAEPKHSNESLTRYAKDQRNEHHGINRAELGADRNLIDEALDLTGLSARGWFVTDTKVNDWCEYVILARARWSPRKSNNVKHIVACLHSAVAAFERAAAEGASAEGCAQVARSAYDSSLGDLGELSAYENKPALFAVEAYRQVRIDADCARLPKKDWERKAWAAFQTVLNDEAIWATGPPN